VKTKIFDIAVLITIVLFLSGCGQREVSDEVRMWLVGSEAESKSVNALALEFFHESGIRVKCQAVSWNEARSKYLTALAGNIPPDIGTMGLTWGSEFGELGAMVDLRQMYEEDIEALRNVVFKGIWESSGYRGKNYGIPFDMTMHLLYYRSDMIPEPPGNWGQLQDLLDGLTVRDKGMIFDWGSMEWIGLSPFLWQAGASFYNVDYTASVLDSKEAVLGMRFFTDLYRKYGVPTTDIPVEQGMRSGDFPLCISGNWKIVGLTVGAPEIKGKWKIAALPAGPSGKRTTFLGGRMMGIFKRSNKKDKAWAFMKYLSRPGSQAFLYKRAIKTQDAYLPPNINTWELLEMEPGFKDVLISQARDAKGPPPVPGWDISVRHIDQAIQRIVLKNADILDEMNKLKKLLDKDIGKDL